jgi:hypothetical protein
LSSGGHRRKLGALLGAAIVTSGALLLVMTRPAEPSEVVAIEILDATIVDGQLAAAVSIENHDSRHQDVQVSLTLGIYGDADAWSRRVAEVSEQPAAIRSGDETLVVWDEGVAVPTGSYELTAWVRTEAPNDVVAQATASFPVEVKDKVLARVTEVDTDTAHFVEMDVASEGGYFLHVVGTGLVANAPPDASVKFDVLTAEATDRAPWWAAEATMTIVVDELEPGPDGSEFAVDQLRALSAGRYRVRAELLDGTTATDSVLLPDLVTVDRPHESIERTEPPSGPLAIIEAATEFDGDDGLIVTVEIQNIEDESVDGLFWWLLAAPGEPEPWRFVEAKSFNLGRRLEAGEQRTIRLALDGDMTVGTAFELSIWAHTTQPDSDDTTHSDGVRHTDLIDTTIQNGA